MNFVFQKICVSYGTVKKISKHFDKKTLLLLYNSLIISHDYFCNKTTASKIQRIANKFVRLTFELHHRANFTDILENNNIMTIDLLLLAFPFSQGWPQRIIILQSFLSSTWSASHQLLLHLFLQHLKIFSLSPSFSLSR